MSLKNKVINIEPECTWKELGGQVIILQATCRPPLTHELNGSGSFFWGLLGNGPRKFEELLSDFKEAYDEKEETLESDLTELINKLEGLNLIRSMN